MAADIAQLYALGVRSVHLHARDAAGRESLRPHDVAATLNASRAACPDMELALSTAEGIAATPQERLECLRAWTVWPDTLCVNLAEEGIQDVLGTPQPGIPHAIHGMDATAYPLLRRAAQLTRASRIGFEDVLTLPDGSRARDNAQLYQAALELMKENP